jgi:hypothetical protein
MGQDIKQILAGLRKDGQPMAPFDLEKLKELTFPQLIQVRDALRHESEEIYGSDLADPDSDAMARILNLEAEVFNAFINLAIERQRNQVRMTISLLRRMEEDAGATVEADA